MATQQEPLILFKLEETWGLPSLSIACIQVEAYLRLAGVPFTAESLASASASPTGSLPALDTQHELVGIPAAEAIVGAAGEHAAAVEVIGQLKSHGADLDRGLGEQDRGTLFALQSVLESKLLPALIYSTWVEDDAFRRLTKDAYGRHQPFPLSRIYPAIQRRRIAATFGRTPAHQIYEHAKRALDSFAAQLARSSGPYLFGSSPRSLDALLYGALSYLWTAPVVHADLRAHLSSLPALAAFSRHVGTEAFGSPPPAAAHPGLRWSEASGAGTSAGTNGRSASAAESELSRKGKIWLACAAGAIVAYVVLGGHYVQFGYDDEDYDEDEFDE